jgi:REP element-mobilizing transposase RayT
MRQVLAYHVIITAYGFWLPNDPRGSWSDFVRAWELFRFGGPATKVDTRRSVAGNKHDRQFRQEMKDHLAREPVHFNGHQARAIARGIASYSKRSGCIVVACAIMPDHIHLVILRHTCDIEQVTRLMKGAATSELNAEGLHPFADSPYRDGTIPTPWARNQWKCFLWDNESIQRAIKYVNENPLKEGLPAQHWKFVSPFYV